MLSTVAAPKWSKQVHTLEGRVESQTASYRTQEKWQKRAVCWCVGHRNRVWCAVCPLLSPCTVSCALTVQAGTQRPAIWTPGPLMWYRWLQVDCSFTVFPLIISIFDLKVCSFHGLKLCSEGGALLATCSSGADVLKRCLWTLGLQMPWNTWYLSLKMGGEITFVSWLFVFFIRFTSVFRLW